MTALPQRQELVSMIGCAREAGARLERACTEVGISVRTFQRWTEDGGRVRADARPDAMRPSPSNKLSTEERAAVLATCMEPRFADMPPTQIVPILADEGVYKASESTMYRILHEHDAQHHRGRAQRRTARKPATHVAHAPNEVWCWDVTYLPSRVRGLFFYLYAVIDLYSRKLVAWEVHAAENGAAQRSYTLRAKLQDLGIEPSYSRPGVSDDNAFIESLFRTLKYVPAYPSAGFTDLAQAQAWTQRFVDWYNGHHRHRGIGFVTPNQRHTGQSAAIPRSDLAPWNCPQVRKGRNAGPYRSKGYARTNQAVGLRHWVARETRRLRFVGSCRDVPANCNIERVRQDG